MLIDFRVKNFKSFKDDVEFSMVKGKAKNKSERTFELKNLSVLKFSSLFGANASGKSNLVQALQIMRFLVLNSALPVEAINEYYRLDDACKGAPTYFEAIISLDGKIYSYGFEVSLSSNAYSSEWLMELKKTRDGSEREILIYKRENNKIELSNALRKKESGVSTRLDVYKEDTEINPNILFLHRLNKEKNVLFEKGDEDILILKKVYDWFMSSLVIINPNAPFTSAEYLSSESKLAELVNLLKAFDTGITQIREVPSTEEEFIRKNRLLLEPLKSEMIKRRYLLNSYGKLDSISLMVRSEIDFWIIVLDEKGVFSYQRLVFLHDDNSAHDFSLRDESDGTLRIFDLAEVLLSDSNDRTFVIDELDRCLHPALTVQFVKLFLKQASQTDFTNQLIVTTHESRLLDLNILRRDEIWFVTKTDGISKLYSLEEYNERFDRVIDKAYLEGRYGGIPIFETIYFPEYIKDENSAKRTD